MRTHSETVSYRADQDLLKMIDTERARFGISRGSWTRAAVTSHLQLASRQADQENTEGVEERLRSMEQSLESISNDIAKALFFILTNVGEMTRTEAKDLIREELGQ